MIFLNPLRLFKQISRKQWYWIAAICLAGFLFILSLPWMVRAALYYETPLKPADLVLVGGPGNALETAVRMHKEGIAKKILVTVPIPKQFQDDPQMVTIHQMTLDQLDKLDVNPDDIYKIQNDANTMLERQLYFRNWMKEHDFHSYIVFPNEYHARFSKMLHDHTFHGMDVEIIILPSKSNNVMRKEFLNIQNTIIRMIYWQLVYAPKLQEEVS